MSKVKTEVKADVAAKALQKVAKAIEKNGIESGFFEAMENMTPDEVAHAFAMGIGLQNTATLLLEYYATGEGGDVH